MRNRVWKPIVLGSIVSTVHLAFMLYLLSQAAPGRAAEVAWDVIAFPLLYAERLQYRGALSEAFDFDWAPYLVVGNSLLWGIVAAVLCFWLIRLRMRESAKTQRS